MANETFGSFLWCSRAGVLTQAMDTAAIAERRPTPTAYGTFGADGHRRSHRGSARVAVAGLLIAAGAAGATLAVVLGA